MSQRRCPRDGAPLAAHSHLGQPWHVCGQCRGMLLPLSMVAELVPLLDEIIARSATWPRSGLGCPQCGRTLHLAHYQGIEIDLCQHCHAVWLDGGETDRFALARTREEVKEEVLAEGMTQAPNALSGADLAKAIDWLGDAFGALLSP